jgi:hypothetical protein
VSTHFDDWLVAAVVSPGEIQEDSSHTRTLVVEMSGIASENGGAAVFQIMITDLNKPDGYVYKSPEYVSPHFANVEWRREVGRLLPLEAFCPTTHFEKGDTA